jgi:hypothetical protein
VVAACDVGGRTSSAVLRSYVVVSMQPGADRVELLRPDRRLMPAPATGGRGPARDGWG